MNVNSGECRSEHCMTKGRIRIKLKGRIRIRNNLYMKSQNVWQKSIFEKIFKVLNLYLEAIIRIRIRIKVTSRIRIGINGKQDPDPHQCNAIRCIELKEICTVGPATF